MVLYFKKRCTKITFQGLCKVWTMDDPFPYRRDLKISQVKLFANKRKFELPCCCLLSD